MNQGTRHALSSGITYNASATRPKVVPVRDETPAMQCHTCLHNSTASFNELMVMVVHERLALRVQFPDVCHGS
jgi:hypothetical protein